MFAVVFALKSTPDILTGLYLSHEEYFASRY